MSLFNRLFSPPRQSAAIAKERLKIVLAHERVGRNAPDFLPKLQKELIDVVGRYVSIRDDTIRVNLGKSGETSLLEINVEIDAAQPPPASATLPLPRNPAALANPSAPAIPPANRPAEPVAVDEDFFIPPINR